MRAQSASNLLPPEDQGFMERAVSLGRAGWGTVHPNPMVGCVLVREGQVVGEGWHQEFGGPHAEVMALSAAGDLSRGAIAYVSLEPCRHVGKTPPCTEALITAGVSRVVFGAEDPGERSGGGGAVLRQAGIDVAGPIMPRRAARWENPFFFHRDEGRPWLALKLAVSLDGGIASAPGERTTLSGPKAMAEVHRLRAGFDAILVGTRTARVDDPILTVRGPVNPRIPPIRIMLDARGTMDPDARILHEGEGEVWVITSRDASDDWRQRITAAGARLKEVPRTQGGHLDLTNALHLLKKEGVRSVLCEGGGVLGSALLRSGLVDRMYLIVAPRFLGPMGVPAFPGLGDIGSLGDEGRIEMREARLRRSWVHGEAPRLLDSDLWIALEPEEA